MKLFLLYEIAVKALKQQTEVFLCLFSKKYGKTISALWVFCIIRTSFYPTAPLN